MIIEQIKKDKMEAMKSRDKGKLAFLTVVYSEIMMFGKNNGNRETTEAEATKILQKFVKSAEETISIGEKAGRDISKSKTELKILAQYLPQQMSEEEIKSAVEEIVSTLSEKNVKAMGTVMAQLKAKYQGKYDGKLASAIVKSSLL